MKAELFHAAGHELAEGPVWHDRALWWVNILAGELHRLDPVTAKAESCRAGRMLGAAAPAAAGGRWMLAAKDGFHWLDWASGKLQPIANPEADKPDNRFNDGKCDPAGRFWAGTMHLRGQRDRGALYVLDRDLSVRRALAPLSLSNGMAWSADGGTMYHIDTPTRTIAAYDFDVALGTLENRRLTFDFAKAEQGGYPDGMTIDHDGRLWVALWGGACVACVDPRAGRIVEKVELPVANASSCCFGGARLDELFITTAWQGLSPEQRKQQPDAGGIFRCRPGTHGVGTNVFRGM
jgi:sugar lactone lactonase YvrE